MCSGCSGDHAGDFEDFSEPTADSVGGHRPAWDCGEPEANEHFFRTEGANGFEASSNSEWDSQSASLPGSKGRSGGEIYEIMVSETRIVEIRVVRANSEEIKEFREAQAAEMPAVHKHWKAAGSKYYQTRRGYLQRTGDRVQVPWCRWVALSVAGDFKRWGRWARKILGNYALRISERGQENLEGRWKRKS